MNHISNSVKLFAVACGIALAAFVATQRAEADSPRAVGFSARGDGNHSTIRTGSCSGDDSRICISTDFGDIRGTWHQTF